MSPADIIAREPERIVAIAINKFLLEYTECYVDEDAVAQAVITALQAAGARLISEGKYDPVTIEACAEVADEHGEAWGLAHRSPALVIAAAIRKLAEERK